MIKRISAKKALAFVPVLLALVTGAAFAGTHNLPWEGPLNNLLDVISGPTAKAISIIAIVIAGAALVFGEDLGQFTRRLLLIVLAVALILGAGQLILGLNYGPAAGALI